MAPLTLTSPLTPPFPAGPAVTANYSTAASFLETPLRADLENWPNKARASKDIITAYGSEAEMRDTVEKLGWSSPRKLGIEIMSSSDGSCNHESLENNRLVLHRVETSAAVQPRLLEQRGAFVMQNLWSGNAVKATRMVDALPSRDPRAAHIHSDHFHEVGPEGAGLEVGPCHREWEVRQSNAALALPQPSHTPLRLGRRS